MLVQGQIIMKKLLLISIILLSVFHSNAQVTLCLGQDATVCQGQTVTINDCSGGGSGGGNGLWLPNPTTLSLGDDNWSGVVPIGFNFNFYGNTYSSCVVGSNGLISFNTSNANSFCSWSLSGTPIPTTSLSTAFNSVMLAYCDLLTANPPVRYQTIGTAPNRKFVVFYGQVSFFSCTNDCITAAMILNETSNTIEFHIGQKGECAGWNSGLAIQGVENASGTVATATPGRNNTVWTATMDGKLFSPVSPTNTSSYTVSTIPYVNVNAPNVGTNMWASTIGQTFPYNGGTLNVTSVPPGTTGYFITSTGCNGVSVGSVSDTTWITRETVNGSATATTDYCNGGLGSATVTPTQGTSPFTYSWSPGGQTTQTVNNLTAGTYTVTITSASGCPKNISVVVPNATASFAGDSTQVSCPGGSDGTATATMTPSIGTVTYQWDDPMAQTTQTATGLAAGTYHCTVTSDVGCSGTVTVVVTEIPGMIGTVYNVTNVSCNSLNDGSITISVTGGTPGYTYAWDNSPSTDVTASGLYAGTYTVTITDSKGCIISLTQDVTEPTPLKITAITPDTIICPESSIKLWVAGTGGNGPSGSNYTFTWSENGTVIGIGDSITVDPANTNTSYCVKLSETCGSPTTDSCLVISFPTPIVPAYVAVQNGPTICEPAEFVINDQSNDQNEIQSVFFDFGDGQTATINGPEDTTHIYLEAGTYNANATVTSIYGCVYTADFPVFASVVENPTAAFSFSTNPTSMFETTVNGQNASSQEVVSWEWLAPGADPASSTVENPSFMFPEGIVGNYPVTLIVTTAEGCRDTVMHELIVNSEIIFFAPNAFTPDGDEFNQTWMFSVQGIDPYNFDLLVFDRWGEVIWETKDPTQGWDGTYNGKPCPEGTYIWVARVKDIYTDGKKTFNGAITLIR